MCDCLLHALGSICEGVHANPGGVDVVMEDESLRLLVDPLERRGGVVPLGLAATESETTLI